MNSDTASKSLKMEPARFRYLELLCQELLSTPGPGFQREYVSRDLKVLETADRLLREGVAPASLKVHLRRSLSPRREGDGHSGLAVNLQKACVISISSGKGGVGKSTLALNLGVELKRAGHRVVVVDADLGTANLHLMAGIRPGRTLHHVISGECPIEDIILQVIGGPDIICGSSGILELANMNRQKRELLLSELARLEHLYDVILVDTAAGVAASVIDFVSSSDFALVVTSPEVTSITDAYAVIKLAVEHDRDCRLGLVANRVRSVSEGASVLGRISKCATRFLLKPVLELGFIWEDSNVRRAVNAGCPLAIQHPDSRASLAIRKLARVLGERELILSRRKSYSSRLTAFANGPARTAAGLMTS